MTGESHFHSPWVSRAAMGSQRLAARCKAITSDYVRHHWRAGERMPAHCRTTRYVVHDDRHDQPYSPPRGYHRVRVDNDVVLAAVATGLVTAAVYGIFY